MSERRMDSGFWTGMAVMTMVFTLWFVVLREREKARRERRERERPHCSADWVRSRLKALAEPSLLLVPSVGGRFS
jgi:hypothetical protein